MATNGNHEDPQVVQLQNEMEAMRAIVEEQTALLRDQQGVPIRNRFGNVNVQGPPVVQEVNANTFELRSGLIQLAKDIPFAGRAMEDAHLHLTKFLEISNTCKLNGVSDSAIRMKLFPLSLVDNTKDWYNNLEPGLIASWDQMARKFLDKYFTLSTSLKLQAEIAQFKMRDQESVGEAWGRFKSLIKKCPNHGFTAGHQVSMFYAGCHQEVKSQLDYGCHGSFLDMGDVKC